MAQIVEEMKHKTGEVIEEEITQEEYDSMKPLPLPTVDELKANRNPKNRVNVMIHIHENHIILGFGYPITSVEMDTETARSLATALRQASNSLDGMTGETEKKPNPKAYKHH
jgi:hypothetical protein